MKLWLASTDSALVARYFDFGLFEGVLTNPTTLAGAKRPPLEIMRELCAATSAPVFYQLSHTTVDGMKAQVDRLISQGWPNLGIKVPITPAGLAVLAWLRTRGIALRLATAVPNTALLLLTTALEVPWITPSGSVLEKLGGPGKIALLTEMQTALDRQKSPATLIPSLSSPAEMQALGLAGLRSGFVWDRDVERFIDSELVRQIVTSFDQSWTTLEKAAPCGY